MKYLLILCLLGAVLIDTVASEIAANDKQSQSVVKSSVTKKAEDSAKAKVDAETKEQLQESENDDKELEKQQEDKESSGDQADDEEADNAAENVEESSNESPEEASSNNDAENEDNSDSENESVRRTEEAKVPANKKKGEKLLAYPSFYPGNYFGSPHQGGPAQFNPAGFWQYPYPYVHPMYPQFNPNCECKCNEDKEEEKEKGEGKGKKNRRKQLVPSHLYGSPKAGWGGFTPGQTGAGWGTPYWYKSYIPSSVKQASRRFGIEGEYQDGHPMGSYGQHYFDGGHGLGYGQSDLGGYGYSGGDHMGTSWAGGYAGYGWNGYPSNGYGGHGYGGHGYGGHGYGGHGYGGHGYGGSYGDIDNSDNYQSWGNYVGHPYIPKHGGHHHSADNHGQAHIDIHHGHAFFGGPELAYQHLPTAQGHIQIASSGHNIGMGGHNLGGVADKQDPGHGNDGDFVGGIHTDLAGHGHHGHPGPDHHGHVGAHFASHMLDDAHADMHVQHPSFHNDHDSEDYLGLHGELGDHFGAEAGGHSGRHGVPAFQAGMSDHFGPLLENDDGEESEGDLHESLSHHGSAHNTHALGERILQDFGTHAGHGGAFDGHIGNTVLGGHHKSGLPAQQKKPAKKLKRKAKARAFMPKGKNTPDSTKEGSEQLP